MLGRAETSFPLWRKSPAKPLPGPSRYRLRKARMISIGRNKGATSMAHKFLTRRFITWRVLPLLLIGLVGAWFALKPGLSAFVSKPGLLAGRSAAVGSNMPQDAFEQRVRTYLCDHPE